MILSTRVQYALMALHYIALHQKESKLPVRVVLEKMNISQGGFLAILNDLARTGILLSRRGPRGGYVLAREPEKISLFDIFKAIEGSNFEPFNFIDKSNEPFLIKMKEVSIKANSELKKILSETTLADMIKK